jgi:hypothetical protein
VAVEIAGVVSNGVSNRIIWRMIAVRIKRCVQVQFIAESDEHGSNSI